MQESEQGLCLAGHTPFGTLQVCVLCTYIMCVIAQHLIWLCLVVVWEGLVHISWSIWHSQEYRRVSARYYIVDLSCLTSCSLCNVGAKELNLAATVEHLRDNRPNMVRSKVSKALAQYILWVACTMSCYYANLIVVTVPLSVILPLSFRPNLSLLWLLWWRRHMKCWMQLASDRDIRNIIGTCF